MNAPIDITFLIIAIKIIILISYHPYVTVRIRKCTILARVHYNTMMKQIKRHITTCVIIILDINHLSIVSQM